jgi:hypothetical protein
MAKPKVRYGSAENPIFHGPSIPMCSARIFFRSTWEQWGLCSSRCGFCRVLVPARWYELRREALAFAIHPHLPNGFAPPASAVGKLVCRSATCALKRLEPFPALASLRYPGPRSAQGLSPGSD